MPTYEYQCELCQYEFETYQSIHEDSLTECPKCNAPEGLCRKIQTPMFFVKGEAKTIGHLADRNAAKLGKDEVQERTLRKQERTRTARKYLPKVQPKVPWWRDGSIPGLKKKAMPLTVEEAKEYTNDGSIRITEPDPKKQPKHKT